MLKNILNSKNTQELSTNEQRAINGGGAPYCDNGLEPCFDRETHRWSCVPRGRCGYDC